MRPPGPEPWMALRFTPSSPAKRRASGEAITRPAGAAGATGAGATGAGAAGRGAAAGAATGAAATGAAAGAAAGVAGAEAPPSSAEMSSSAVPMTPTSELTGAVVPSVMSCLRSTPSPRATSSMTALSVSTSARISPAFTAAPSAFSHFTRRPSSIVGLKASMNTFVAIVGIELREQISDASRGSR